MYNRCTLLLGKDHSICKKLLLEGWFFFSEENERKILIYAKTYVPAIEVNGLEEYFEKQSQDHYSYY